jgi:hypothetical protein
MPSILAFCSVKITEFYLEKYVINFVGESFVFESELLIFFVLLKLHNFLVDTFESIKSLRKIDLVLVKETVLLVKVVFIEIHDKMLVQDFKVRFIIFSLSLFSVKLRYLVRNINPVFSDDS